MTHRLTPVQKRVLRYVLDAPEPVVFCTGHKTTVFDGCGFVVYCQSFIPYFLKFHGYIHKPNEASNRWELTEKGVGAVAGKRQAARSLEATT